MIAERALVRKKRRIDPEAREDFGTRRGDRHHKIELADGARLFVEESGPESKRGAVFIHGSVLRTDVWHYQIGGLGPHRTLFYDLRGHGLSTPKGETPYKLSTLSDDLATVIEDAGLDEAVIVGHSVGGMIALELCARRPDWLGSRIKGLVLANTTYGPVTETLMGSGLLSHLERATRRPFDVLGTQHHRIESFRRVIRPSDAVFWAVALAAFGPKASARQIDFTYDMLAETPTDVIFDLIKCYRDFDMRERLGEVTVPALVIGGTHDRLTMERASRHLAEHLPKADLHIFERCGHMSMLERHDEFNGLVTRFLDDNLGPPARRTTKRKAGKA